MAVAQCHRRLLRHRLHRLRSKQLGSPVKVRVRVGCVALHPACSILIACPCTARLGEAPVVGTAAVHSGSDNEARRTLHHGVQPVGRE